jgi:hypothetical protein
MLEQVELVKFSNLVHHILNILFIAATGHILSDTGLCCLPLNSKPRSCSSAASTMSDTHSWFAGADACSKQSCSSSSSWGEDMHVCLDIHQLLLHGRHHRLAVERLWSHFRDVSPSTAVDVGFALSTNIATLRCQHVPAGTSFLNSMQSHSAVHCLTFCCLLRHDEFCCTWYVCLTTSSTLWTSVFQTASLGLQES